MKTYAVVALTSTTDDWQAAYGEAVFPLIGKHGGHYLARTASHTRMEGDGPSPQIWVIVEFPNRAAADAFYQDPAYQPFLRARLDGSFGSLYFVEGQDDFDAAHH
jgi:uncharacterized protein (DUF1330 family)